GRMTRVLGLVSQCAPSTATSVTAGETGAGKEGIAKANHARSARAGKAFVAVNRGSLPVELLESTLFGHVKGAFTSAFASQKGYFEVANGGTGLFDEIRSISAETQTKPLRANQEKEFIPLGSN